MKHNKNNSKTWENETYFTKSLVRQTETKTKLKYDIDLQGFVWQALPYGTFEISGQNYYTCYL